MKAVVTILQHKRAVLPHIFVAYVLPEMRRRFPGRLEAVLIQHRAHVDGSKTALESSRAGAAKLDLVARFTEEGRYEGADIVAHAIDHPPYPSLPSYHLGVREALDRGADLHLWLEDDVLLFDRDCGRWDTLLGGREVGVYRRFHHLNSAFLLTRRSFDARIAAPLADYDAWSWRTRIEPFLRKQMRTKRAYLEPRHAVRYHHRYYPYTGLRYVVDAVRAIAPAALPLLALDFGEGCENLPPVTAEEMAAHAAQDGARLGDRLWRLRQAATERFLLPDHL